MSVEYYDQIAYNNHLMEGKATVRDNKIARNIGGGVSVNGGTFTMRDSASVSGNTADRSGGRVFIGNEGTFTKTSGNIYGYNAETSLKNTVMSGLGNAVFEYGNRPWRM
jgi:hypothetical protein